MLQKAGIVLVLALLLIGAAVTLVFKMPSLRAERKRAQGDTYAKQEEYEKAISAYQDAISLKSTNKQAYLHLAQTYLAMNDYANAQSILYRGVLETGDEEMEESYITVLLNESVIEMNEERISMETLLRCVDVLEQDSQNAEAVELMETGYQRYFGTLDDNDQNVHIYTDFETYREMMERLLAIYEKEPSQELEEVILRYAYPDSETILLHVENMDAYAGLLERVSVTLSYQDDTEFVACIRKAEEIRDYFAPILREFEKGNFEVAKELIVSAEYLAIRDAFIDGSMPYWKNTTYETVSDIGVMFLLENGRRVFSFMEEEPQNAQHGFIKVWGFRWVDNGRLRTGISYVPVHEGTQSYPYKEYEIMYWWSTVKNQALTVSTYAKMNYRFETRIYTEYDMTTEVINDWGGEYEYKDTYD